MGWNAHKHMLIFLWVPILHLCSPLGRHTFPPKQVPICLCICLRQRSRRSESREAQKSFTSLTQSRYSVVQMERERPRRVTWKQASWLGGGATKSQGEVRIRSPPGFPFCLQDRPLCWAICLGMFSLVFFPAQSNQDLSALPWGAPVPPHSSTPAFHCLLSIPGFLSGPPPHQENHLRPQPHCAVPAPGSCNVTSGRSPPLSESPLLQ